MAESKNGRAAKRVRESGVQLAILIVGFAVSVGLGIIFYIKADIATALATFALILGGLLTLQVEATFRRIREEQTHTEQDRFIALLETEPWLYQFVRETTRRGVDIQRLYEFLLR